MFEIIDTDGSGTVDVTELMQVIHVLTHGSTKERLMMLFSVYDIDGKRVVYSLIILYLKQPVALDHFRITLIKCFQLLDKAGFIFKNKLKIV